MLVDTHVHLNHVDLSDWAALLARAEEASVGAFVVVGYDLASSEKAVVLSKGDARIWATVGIHPHEAESWNDDVAERLASLATLDRVIAWGEIGLDFYRDLSPRKAQFRAFEEQLDLAARLDLPVVIHCRDAYPETLDMLEARHDLAAPVILHCFQGTMRDAERAWARGWFLGVGGAVTFKNQDDLREVVRAAPPESLLLETDAPYLSPVPLRGKYPNEPARVAYVAEKVAELRNSGVEEIAHLTTANAGRAFPLLAAAV